MKKYFGFNDYIYKLNEASIFNDDIFNNDEDILSELNVNNHLMNDKTILTTFNELYANQKKIFKKYAILSPMVFSHISHVSIDGKDYILLDEINDVNHLMYIRNKIKLKQGMQYFISTLELIDFIEEYNIIIQCPLKINVEDYNNQQFFGNTYVIENVNVPDNFINKFLLSYKVFGEDYTLRPMIYFINDTLNNTPIENILNIKKDIIHIEALIIDKCNISSLIIKQPYANIIKILNNNNLNELNITYDNSSMWEWGSELIILNCQNLKNVHIEDISSSINLTKLKITKCDNIDLGNLILPDHTNKGLEHDPKRVKSICFRGPAITWFYRNSPNAKDYRFKNYYYYTCYWPSSED